MALNGRKLTVVRNGARHKLVSAFASPPTVTLTMCRESFEAAHCSYTQDVTAVTFLKIEKTHPGLPTC